MVRLISVLALAVSVSAPCAMAGSAPPSLSRPFDLGLTFVPPAPHKTPAAPSRFAAAPVPNPDEGAPTLRTLGPAQAEFTPGLFNTRKTYRGEGFTAGSSAQNEQQKRFKPTPGVNLSVPLE